MRKAIQGLLFVALLAVCTIAPSNDSPQAFFYLMLGIVAIGLLMWRFDMFDLPKKYRYGKK